MFKHFLYNMFSLYCALLFHILLGVLPSILQFFRYSVLLLLDSHDLRFFRPFVLLSFGSPNASVLLFFYSAVLLFFCSSSLLFFRLCPSVLLSFCPSVLLFFCLFCSSGIPFFRSTVPL